MNTKTMTTKRTAIRSTFAAALAAALCTFGLIQAPSASAAESYIGQQVIKEGNKTVTAQLYACKVHQGSSQYKVRIRAKFSSVANLGGKYRLNVGSNHGAPTKASVAIGWISTNVSVLSAGKVPSTARFTGYVGKGTSAGWINWPGTTLKTSFTVASLPHC